MFNEERKKGMKITIEDLLRDRKDSAYDAHNKIDSILKFFADSQKGNELEKREFNENEYRQLGWYENVHFDVINSFYTTFVCALVAYAKDIKDIKQYWNNFDSDLVKDWKDKPFDFGGILTKVIPVQGDTVLKYLTSFGLCNIKKGKYAEKALNSDNIQQNILEDFKSTNNGELFEELAKLSHCVANFMPCSPEFNSAKGSSIAHDYLPMFVDLIQAHVDANAKDDRKSKYYGNLKYGENKEIKVNDLKKWQKWLIENIDKYCLSCYYEVKDGKLKGKPLFKKKNQSGEQSLDYPYPKELEEVNECVSKMIKCINTRAKELLCRINEQGASK